MKRKIALLLAISLLAFCAIGVAYHHDCSGEDCLICLSLSTARTVLQNLLPITVCAFCASALSEKSFLQVFLLEKNEELSTPVSKFDLLLD